MDHKSEQLWDKLGLYYPSMNLRFVFLKYIGRQYRLEYGPSIKSRWVFQTTWFSTITEAVNAAWLEHEMRTK